MAKSERNKAKADDRVGFSDAPERAQWLVFRAVIENKLELTMDELAEQAMLEADDLQEQLDELLDDDEDESESGQEKEERQQLEAHLEESRDAEEWFSFQLRVPLQDCDLLSGDWTDEERRTLKLALAGHFELIRVEDRIRSLLSWREHFKAKKGPLDSRERNSLKNLRQELYRVRKRQRVLAAAV